jgi:hypothetical protein
MLGGVLELLTGTGLAASAGLNAYIPLLAVGLLARYTTLVSLPPAWDWLSNEWVLGILAVLLVIEVVADKVPVVDSVNDVVQTVVRPTAGGLAFGAGTSAETVTVSNPEGFFSGTQWVPVAAGVLIALLVHALKATARPVINATTAGFGAPVASTAEDATSIVMSVLALLLPVLMVVFFIGFLGLFWWVLHRRAKRRALRRAQREPAVRHTAPPPGHPPTHQWPVR